ncbi:MAG TPA: extracellular solute-binding protein [Xanthobacteraceae bacterium]
MLFRHKLAQTLSAERLQVAIAIKVRRSGGALALVAGLFAAALSLLPFQTASAAGTVKVLYAGSLVNLMEHGIGPAFEKASGATFQGYAGGSSGLANQIKGKLRQGDVFISASPKVNDSLVGAANGDWVGWYITFAQSPLVIGYNAASRFAADLKSKPWYQVLQEPGIRIGRTDPKLDPKGSLTLTLMKQAETFYNSPGLSEKIIGAPDNPEQVLPEEALVGRLQSGQLDVGFFYSTETADAKIPALALPVAIAPKAIYTVTILHNAPNADGADKFVAFLLGNNGQSVMKEHGLDVRKLTLTGDSTNVPKDTQDLLTAAK